MQLPEKFLEMLQANALLAPLAQSLLTPPEVSIRVNNAKPGHLQLLTGATTQVPWCADGWYLDERPSFTFDPCLHQGRYYVQDASSMAISSAVEELSTMLGNHPLLYLDACAAPGGKTTAAIASLPADSYVIANEYDYRRADVLAENVAKWGRPNVAVTRGDTSRFRNAKATFDIVAVDAPCSGEGMMRKEAKAVEQWSPSLVSQCAALQREILKNVWEALKPGGFLIYSTCTFNAQEDEDNLTWLIDTYGAESVKLTSLQAHPAIAHGIDTPHHCYRFLPGRVRGEGLFIAAVRKPGTHAPYSLRPTPAKAKNIASQWLVNPLLWELSNIKDELYAMPTQWWPAVSNLMKRLDAISPGLHIATIKGKDLIPSQELALSIALAPEAFPRCEISADDAIRYLRRESLTLNGAPRGYVLLTYESIPLGFVKNLGNRANNLYPKSWRILSQAH